MKKVWLLIILTPILMALVAAAQTGPRDLQLTVRIVPAVNPAETEIIVTLLNATDHALSLPKPFLSFGGAPPAIIVVSKFEPSDPHAPVMSKSGTFSAVLPPSDILEAAESWIVLGPGQTLDIQDRLLDLVTETGGAGTYRLHVVYSPPSLDAQDRKKLRAAGIYPLSKGDHVSNLVSVEIAGSTSSAN